MDGQASGIQLRHNGRLRLWFLDESLLVSSYDIDNLETRCKAVPGSLNSFLSMYMKLRCWKYNE